MTTLGKYQLHEELGRGGYGTVYRATDVVLEVPRAVKVLHPALVADPSFIERFRREAKFAARMKHPNIVPVYDLDEAEGRFFLAMEYMPGGSLKDLLAIEGPLPYERAEEITGQIAEALDAIHGQNVVHRDVKPGNILFDEKGNVALTDLGFAKALSGADSASLSVTGGMIGTPAYMAPEIWMGAEACSQTDVYSLACVFVEMLTGSSLFGGQGDSPPPLVMKRHFDPLELPPSWPEGVPDGINAVLDKSLAKEPKERYASPGELVAALNELGREPEIVEPEVISEPEVTTARPAPQPEPVQKPSNVQPANVPTPSWWKRWQLWVLSAGAVGFISLCVFVVYTLLRLFYPEVINNVVVSETPLPSETTASVLEVGSTQQSDVDGMMMVYVPVGEFKMGNNEYDEEMPIHTVYLDAFWMDQTEVTNAMYARFLNEMGNQSEGGATWMDAGDENVLIVQSDGEWQPKSGYGNHPVIEVSWYGARAYCEWAGRRLPTETEWEKAARGTDGRTYPWGEEIDCRLAQYDECSGDTMPVGNKPDGVSPYNTLDMAGNVLEWVADWYGKNYYVDSPYQNPSGPRSGEYRILRGGSWFDEGRNLRSFVRFRFNPVGTRFNIGFRCALEATTAPTALPATPAPTLPSIETPHPPSPTAPQLGIGSTQKSDVDSMVQVYVPVGEFKMGSNEYDDEKPIHTVYLDAFWIDQIEVTNTMYAQFLNAMGNQNEGGATWLDAGDEDVLIKQNGSEWQPVSGYGDHPVIEVSWYGAKAYCEWAGRRLPAEAEWEKASRGSLEGKKYPWGDQDPTCTPGAANGAQYDSCSGETVEAGQFAPNGYGLYNMAGNVLEWVADWYDGGYYGNSPSSNPEGPSIGDYRVLRGGSWGNDDWFLRSAYRYRGFPNISRRYLGFRCARSP